MQEDVLNNSLNALKSLIAELLQNVYHTSVLVFFDPLHSAVDTLNVKSLGTAKELQWKFLTEEITIAVTF